jgi:CubicO group peptidase (beta-lactamase class C family)
MSSLNLTNLHDAMATRVDKGELPGAVTLVAHGDEARVDVLGALGFDDARPMRRDTIFRIASLTKPILAVTAMMLVEAGVLALDEPVDRLLPELADRRVLRRIDGPLDDTVPADRPITVEDVLSFRLGHGLLFEPSFNPPFPIVEAGKELELVLAEPDPRTPHGPDEWIRRFGSLPLMRQPGETWQYNTSALVLSVLLARAAGQGLPELMAERVFAPLGMTQTGFWTPAANVDRLPRHYATDFATHVLQEQPNSTADEWTRPPAFPSGAAGLLSTADDYLAFARLLMNDGTHDGRRLLSAESVRALTTNRLTPEQIVAGGPFLGGRGWGLGISVAVEPDEVSATPGRYGWEGGYGTSWFNDPASGVTAILLTQVSDVMFNGVLSEFGRLAIAAREG